MSQCPPQAVILAGGLGSRLGALAAGLPKPMAPVAGRPFLEHVIRQLGRQDFQDVLLLTGYTADVIEAHFGDGTAWGLSIRYSREPQPMGTGGALWLARPGLAARFLLLYGDLYRSFDYAGFAARRRDCALAVYPYIAGLTTIGCANVGLDPSGRRVARYTKDGGADVTHVDAGFGVFTRDVTTLLPDGPSSFETIAYPALAAAGRLEAEVVDRDFFDIGNPADLMRTREQLASRLDG